MFQAKIKKKKMGFALDKFSGSVVTKVVAKGAAESAGIKIDELSL